MKPAPLRIDLDSIIRSRVGGWKGRLIPRFLTAALERLIHQEELNETLRVTFPAEGTEFAEAVYRHFGLTLDVEGLENIPKEGRFIFASNHPLGGLDGIGLIKVLGGIYGDSGVRFLVNDMLMNVEPLRPVFLPINKYGSQGRAAAKAIAGAYGSDAQILIFPAGLVSRLHPDGEIRDLQWQKSFIAKALEYDRAVVPVYFEGRNRMSFYRTAKWRKLLGLKINIEQALLPSELCASRSGRYRVVFGKPVSCDEIREEVERSGLAGAAASVRDKVYALAR